MAGISKPLFKKFPSTKNVEEYWSQLQSNYDKFIAFENSEELQRYRELETLVNSPEFQEEKSAIESLNYKGSEAFEKEQEFLNLKKNAHLKLYFKTVDSEELNRYNSIHTSEKLEEYANLKEFVESDEFKELKVSIKFENTDTYKQAEEFRSLKASKSFKDYFKLAKSKLLPAFQETRESGLFDTFKELEAYITSSEFTEAKNSIDKKEFNESEAGQKLNEYNALKKNRSLKAYIKFVNTPQFENFKQLENSEELQNYIELEQFVNSDEFKTIKQNATFEKSEAYLQFQKYQGLKKDADIRFYQKFGAGKAYKNYIETDESDILSRFGELKEYTESEEFAGQKEYLLDKKRYEKTDTYKELQEFETLKNSEDLQWYFKTEAKNEFDQLKKWELVFEDDFNQGALDKDKWLTRFFWGETFLKESYSIASEKQAYNEENNLEIENGVLSIETRKETKTAKAWSPKVGFINKEFEYTSGLISTAQSFRQQYGKFSAKIKADRKYPINHNFWLGSEKNTPHIDIAKFNLKNKKKIMGNFFGGNADNSVKFTNKISAPDTNSDFHIYSIEWTPEGITWLINDIPVKSYTGELPDVPMYVILSSGLNGDINESKLPGKLQIDWVRCYKAN